MVLIPTSQIRKESPIWGHPAGKQVAKVGWAADLDWLHSQCGVSVVCGQRDLTWFLLLSVSLYIITISLYYLFSFIKEDVNRHFQKWIIRCIHPSQPVKPWSARLVYEPKDTLSRPLGFLMPPGPNGLLAFLEGLEGLAFPELTFFPNKYHQWGEPMSFKPIFSFLTLFLNHRRLNHPHCFGISGRGIKILVLSLPWAK